MKKRKKYKYKGLSSFIENGVCFVCTANMGRSAMAEAIAKEAALVYPNYRYEPPPGPTITEKVHWRHLTEKVR